ncbi:hypothetical protein E2C01_048770 [Portunus trituberculatus]|uniref:Uncharacterized protein n=1 Tax=Portunus trituberculatus TaxID=210409 RepID=A0A5B7G7B6_PORTR|nr:hypothetical protein [Portunus trituberculatus]
MCQFITACRNLQEANKHHHNSGNYSPNISTLVMTSQQRGVEAPSSERPGTLVAWNTPVPLTTCSAPAASLTCTTRSHHIDHSQFWSIV